MIRRYGLCTAAAALMGLSLSGCMTLRSISDSGYGYYGFGDFYRGEISELSVLGIDPAEDLREEDIAAAFGASAEVRIPPGSALLVIQSGALFPDEPLQRRLGEHFRVGPLSGVPSHKPGEPARGTLNRALRLAAAEGGYDYILCCWGVVEAEQSDLPTKTVSWIPVVGRSLPDQAQRMRVRLKAILMDARTGRWALLAPAPAESDTVSTPRGRRQSDQAQVEKLKEEAYAVLVEDLLAHHTAR